MVDDTIARRVFTALHQTLAPFGSKAIGALDRPECRAASQGLAEACATLTTTANAWDGTVDRTLEMERALSTYRQALTTALQITGRIALETLGRERPQ